MTAAIRHGCRSVATAAQALAIVAISTSIAAAAALIPSSELPGRERYRFVDPPGARLLQPGEPNTILPWEARPPGPECRPGSTRGKKKARKHRRC
jgi:hypothetical protein